MKYKQLALDSAAIQTDADERRFSGYASVFGMVDAVGDQIAKGAYTETLRDRDRPVRMRWNHFGPVIGVWETMREDDKGLYVEGSLTPGHSVAEDVFASLQHGAVDGLSIGFVPKSWHDDEDKGITVLTEIDLIEISVVEEPADLGARVDEVKHLSELIKGIDSLKECEAILREAGGFSRSAATALVSQVKRVAQRQQRSEEAAPAMSWRLYKSLYLNQSKEDK